MTYQNNPENTKPAGTGNHKVIQGQSLASIAADTGHNWEALWQLPENDQLRENRNDPMALLPGDRIQVPGLQTKNEPGGTEQKHRFKRESSPVPLRIAIEGAQGPRSNERYELIVDGEFREGQLDSQGQLDELIPGNAKSGTITLGEEPRRTHYKITFDTLNPTCSLSGIQGRLQNLGYDPGPIDGLMGPLTRSAVLEFQADHKSQLAADGIPGPKTQEHLDKVYRCTQG